MAFPLSTRGSTAERADLSQKNLMLRVRAGCVAYLDFSALPILALGRPITPILTFHHSHYPALLGARSKAQLIMGSEGGIIQSKDTCKGTRRYNSLFAFKGRERRHYGKCFSSTRRIATRQTNVH